MTDSDQHLIRVVASHALNACNLPHDDRRAGIVAKHLSVIVEQLPDPRDARALLPVPRVVVSDGKGGARMLTSLVSGQPEHYPIGRFVDELARSTPELHW